MNIRSVIDLVTRGLDSARGVLKPIPGLLLKCTCARRPGLSAVLTSASVMGEMERNDNDDILASFIFNVVNRLKEEMQNNGVCLIAIPPGGLTLTLNGGNAGGPAVLQGTNTNYVFVWGIIR